MIYGGKMHINKEILYCISNIYCACKTERKYQDPNLIFGEKKGQL